jgi:DNA polymerase III subunit chi
LSAKIIFLTLSVANKLRVVCDVVENEFLLGKKVVVNVSDEEEGKVLDNMLWSWKQSSFIPHSFVTSLTESTNDPVLITTDISENLSYETMILVNPSNIEKFNNYTTVIDFAEKYNPTKIETDRKRYKLYRDQKFIIETMNPGEYLHK